MNDSFFNRQTVKVCSDFCTVKSLINETIGVFDHIFISIQNRTDHTVVMEPQMTAATRVLHILDIQSRTF